MSPKANDYSKVFAEANKNADLQRGKMKPQAYSELKMTLEELEGFCTINPTKTLFQVAEEYFKENYKIAQERSNQIKSDAQKFCIAHKLTGKERDDVVISAQEKADAVLAFFKDIKMEVKKLLNNKEGFFDTVS